MREPLQNTDSLTNYQLPDSLINREKTFVEKMSEYHDSVLGIDFEDKLIIYIVLLLFTWISNTGIVMQVQFKKDVNPFKVALYSIFIPVAIFMILVPILMYFEIWANYRALLLAVVASNFFIYFITKSAVTKKQRLLQFTSQLNEVRESLLNVLEKNEREGDSTERLKDFKKELEDFGPKYYNGL